MHLPDAYAARMQIQLGAAYNDYRSALDAPARRALRVNTLKVGVRELCGLIPGLTPTGLCAEGFLVPDSLSPGRDPFHMMGLYYMQEPSAQVPVTLAPPFPSGRPPIVLDLCAAPGGKSTQLAALMQNRGLLLSNEPVPSRADTLMRNFERLGVVNGIVTSMQPDALCPLLADSCDLVLVDAPCSGEGMFRKEPEAVLAWSCEHVHASAIRQGAILNAASRCVRPGGALLYSTCTFSPEEDEGVIDAFLSSHSDFMQDDSCRLYPHTCCGEGQFVARLIRQDSASDAPALLFAPSGQDIPSYLEFVQTCLHRPVDRAARLLPDGRVVLLPELVPKQLSSMRVRIAGLPVGEVRQNRFVPAHALFLACKPEDFETSVALTDDTLPRFLAGETLSVSPSLKSYAAVAYAGFNLGFGKASGGILKNHFPKGLRLR